MGCKDVVLPAPLLKNHTVNCLTFENNTRLYLQMQKNQLSDLQVSLEHYCNVLPELSYNSRKYDIILIKSNLLPIPVNGRDIEPTVIKKANQFIWFKFGDIQLLDIANFFGGATSHHSFLKAYKSSEPDKMQNTEHPPYNALQINLVAVIPLEQKTTTMLIYGRVD